MKTLLLALAILLTGCGYDDETLAAENYAQMVCGGAWPDFKGLNPDCEDRRVVFEFNERY